MKITISVVVELTDPAQWAEEFGIPATKVADDVRDYALNLVRDAEVWDGVDATISLQRAGRRSST